MNTNAKLTHDIHAHFCAGRLDLTLEMASSDVEVHFQPVGQVFRGREGLMQFMLGFKNAFPDIEITHTNVVTDGDQVAVEFSWTGTHTGTLMGPKGPIAPTGKRVTDGRVCEVMRWKDGKVTRISNYQDLGRLLRALGIDG